MAQDETQPGVLDGRYRRVLYAFDRYRCKAHQLRQATGFVRGRGFLESALEELMGVDGDIFSTARCDLVDDPYRADRIQEQHVEAASYFAAVLHDDLLRQARGHPRTDASVLCAVQYWNLFSGHGSVPDRQRHALPAAAATLLAICTRESLVFRRHAPDRRTP